MRVISMQGKVVWDILQRDKVYYADRKLAREQNNYDADIKRLNGYVPIWCYYQPELNFYTMYDGEVLDDLRSLMSLERKNCWDNFLMLELEVPDNKVRIGLTYNASAYAKIIPELRLDMVKAVYTARDANTDNPYWKIIKPIWFSGTDNSDVITTSELNCEKVTQYAEEYTGDFTKDVIGRCLLCGEDVPYVSNGKHFCSLSCMWEHRRKFIRIANKEGIIGHNLLKIYDRLTDSDFKRGIVKAVRELK